MNKKILIIEDNIVTLGDLEIRVGKMGFSEVETAVSGEEALDIIERFTPDLILSDINLGEGLSGVETVKIIKEKFDVPVVYLTAYNDDKTLQAAKITEPHAYLLKPLHERELQIALNISLYKHKTEHELKEALIAKNKFISILGHDLRNSFNGMIGLSDLLMISLDNDIKEDLRKYAKTINKLSKETYSLLNNLLEWSRSQMDSVSFSPEELNVGESIQTVIDQVNQTALSKDIKIQINVADSLYADADPHMLQVIIRNLLSNAIKYTPKSGMVKLTYPYGHGCLEV